MIALFTDFGWQGPYVGQMKAALYQAGIGSRPIVDLMHDAPAFDPAAAGLLLQVMLPQLSSDCVVIAVVDPGVGGPRRGLMVELDGRWLVGPDNGLFEPLCGAASAVGLRPSAWEIDWRPPSLSASFHGRDLFAPVAAMLARGEAPPGRPLSAPLARAAAEPSAQVIYIDGYGNAMTSIDAAGVSTDTRVEVAGRSLRYGRTFSERPRGAAFWYPNSLGLLEIAVNCGNAAAQLGIGPGTPVALTPGAGRPRS